MFGIRVALAIAAACALAGSTPHLSWMSTGGQPAAVRPALLLTVPLQATLPATARSYAVQLRRLSASGTSRALYRPFTVLAGANIAISHDARLLAYSDAGSEVHLVALSQGRDRLLERGIQPAFSSDGRHVAFLSGQLVPVPGGPGPQADRINVYDTRTLAHRTIVATIGQLITAFAWAPHDERLAWQISDATGHVLFALGAADRPGLGRVVRRTQSTTDGGLAWTADGRALLYWHFVGLRTTHKRALPYFALQRWALPAGPVTTFLAATPTQWGEGLPPAAVIDAHGTRVASLLGGPVEGLDQITVFACPYAQPQYIALPGEPRSLAFDPAGDPALVVWQAPRGAAVTSRAALINTRGPRTQDLGPAVAAFWVH